MISEAQMALLSLQATQKILTAALSLKKQIEIEQAVRKAHESLGEALVNWIASQERYATLQTEVDELKQHVRSLENWEAEKQGYEPKQVATGVFAYVRKGDTTPSHECVKLCATCFHDSAASILQAEPSSKSGTTWSLKCGRCKNSVAFLDFVY